MSENQYRKIRPLKVYDKLNVGNFTWFVVIQQTVTEEK